MATLGTKSVLINSLAAWGVVAEGEGAAAKLTIPGFGYFADATKVLNNSGLAGAAATPGEYTLTLAGTPSELATVVVGLNQISNRMSSDNVRFKTDPGMSFKFTVLSGTPTEMATEVKKQMEANPKFNFTVAQAAGVLTLTAKDEYTTLKAEHSGFNGQPYVESVSTGRELPGEVTGAVAETSAPVSAVGLGKDLEENEFLDTAFSVQPYGEVITDRPIKGALYTQIHFDIPRTHVHEVQGSYDQLKGSVSFSIYILKSEVDGAALAVRKCLNDFAGTEIVADI